jgi:hypothetical protein
VKKIEPTKKTTPATSGDSDDDRLSGTPTAKHADPMTKSHAIQAVARNVEGTELAVLSAVVETAGLLLGE